MRNQQTLSKPQYQSFHNEAQVVHEPIFKVLRNGKQLKSD